MSRAFLIAMISIPNRFQAIENSIYVGNFYGFLISVERNEVKDETLYNYVLLLAANKYNDLRKLP